MKVLIKKVAEKLNNMLAYLKPFMNTTTLLTVSSGFVAFLCSYFLDLAINNSAQYMAVTLVVFVDGFFGVWSGVKREGFKTYKAIKVIKDWVVWLGLLTVVLSIELGFPGTGWLSETVVAPFVTFQLISALKNAGMVGVIPGVLLNEILDKIDRHKHGE